MITVLCFSSTGENGSQMDPQLRDHSVFVICDRTTNIFFLKQPKTKCYSSQQLCSWRWTDTIKPQELTFRPNKESLQPHYILCVKGRREAASSVSLHRSSLRSLQVNRGAKRRGRQDETLTKDRTHNLSAPTRSPLDPQQLIS